MSFAYVTPSFVAAGGNLLKSTSAIAQQAAVALIARQTAVGFQFFMQMFRTLVLRFVACAPRSAAATGLPFRSRSAVIASTMT
jgi:hypothetical protein